MVSKRLQNLTPEEATNLTDKDFSEILGSAELLERVKAMGAPRNKDGSWHFVKVFAFLCQKSRGRRLRKKPAKF